MKIHVYSIMRNEEFLLPYFLRHYSLFADKIFIIDDHSTDKTAEIAKSNPKVQLLDFEYNRGLNEEDLSCSFEKSYRKYSRGVADWVMCVDGDEFIYNENIVNVLQRARKHGIRAIKSTGYTMVSEAFPTTKGQIYEECCMGSRCRGYDKPVIFDPELCVYFGDGRHTITLPEGVNCVKAKLLLLHYRYLSKNFFLNRSKESFARVEMSDKIKDYRIRRGLKWYDNSLDKLIKVI